MSIEIPAADTQYDDYIIEKVREADEGYEIGFDSGMVSFPPKQPFIDAGIVPKEGDVIRFYGKGFGFPWRGLAINGVGIIYRTEEEDEAKRKQDIADREQREREEFAEKKDEMDARFDALPKPLQDRIARRRRNNPDFRWKYEGYEMFVCEEAVKFAGACADAETNTQIVAEVNAFWEGKDDAPEQWDDRFFGWAWAFNTEEGGYDHERQAEVLGCDSGHSGNTFGAAFTLARLLTRGEDELVDRMYGALAPLVGSEDYGDVDPEDREAEEAVEA